MSTRVAVTVDGLSKCYHVYDRPVGRLWEILSRGRRRFHKEVWALRDVSFQIPRGSFVGVLGRNGAGKSTLLQILAGTLEPTEGTATCNGRLAALLELGAGFNPDFTGRENVNLYCAITGFSPKETARLIPEVEHFAQLGPFFDRPVRIYSSGMYIRLGFAAAIHVDPDVLIIDEALAVGDLAFQKRCLKRIAEIRKRGKTIILVTHDPITVQNLCEQALLFEEGVLSAQGDPKEVSRAYQRLIAQKEMDYYRHTQHAPPAPLVTQPATTASEPPGTISEEETRGHRLEAVPYGSRATITAVRMRNATDEETTILAMGERARVEVDVVFHSPTVEPNVGILIHSAQNIIIFNDSTHYAQADFEVEHAPRSVTVEFEQQMALTAGLYFLSVAVADHAGTVNRFLDERADVIAFRIHSRRHIGGLVDLHSRIRIRDQENAASAANTARDTPAS